ncbi:MAG: 2Fe-2S iron-sulfur cluster binding domain-containing protein [Phycisphaerales bacterium]|nr:MAG: 2Fe-2S iron-sulfur cluster binding domain-containing protein [Phycisphaerales bacterium]
MGGQNPYLSETDTPLPTKKYRITYLPADIMVEVDPGKLPYSGHGLPGSVLDVALAHGIDIDHACGGVCACATCHVLIREGLDTCPEASEDEEDMLDNAPSLSLSSRLACQAVPNGSRDVVVEIPEWNRNLAREDQ